MQSENKKRVGILRGGTGENYGSSIRKGGEILSHISENLSDSWKTFDILIDKEGVWHINGVPIQPADLMHRVDVVWNTAHPNISATLQNLSIPSVGQESFHGTMESSKEMLRKHIQKLGLDMPRSLVLPLYQEDFDGPRERYAIKKAKEVHEKFPAPWIVKSFTEDKNMGPVRGREGSQRPSVSNGMGIHLAKTFPELVDAIHDGAKHEKSILVEEFIAGKIASVHAVPQFRNEEIYVFPLGSTFGNFSGEEKEELANLAKKLYSHLGAKHYLKSDFVLNSRGKIYLLQIESTPDLKQDSHLSQVCELVGANMHQVVEHMLDRSIRS